MQASESIMAAIRKAWSAGAVALAFSHFSFILALRKSMFSLVVDPKKILWRNLFRCLIKVVQFLKRRIFVGCKSRGIGHTA